jgi:hypothetical protein
MSNNTKNIPAYILIIASMVGYGLIYAPTIFQILAMGILVIVLTYETIKLRRVGKDSDKIGVAISSIILAILLIIAVVGKSYANMGDNTELIILFIAFMEFFLAAAIFGHRIVTKSENNERIRQFKIGASIIIGSLLLFGLVILLSVLNVL